MAADVLDPMVNCSFAAIILTEWSELMNKSSAQIVNEAPEDLSISFVIHDLKYFYFLNMAMPSPGVCFVDRY